MIDTLRQLHFTQKLARRSLLTRDDVPGALSRWLRWQIGSRLVPGPVSVPFAGSARLLVSRGMTGATGNIYMGLHEPRSMALVLHLLRPGDLFLDLGANVGSFTILGAETGARVIAVEPHGPTADHLRANIALNGFGDRVEVLQTCIGKETGTVFLADTEGPMNHVAKAGTPSPIARLDDLVSEAPALIKMDIEGLELDAIDGGERVFRSAGAVSVEIGGALKRYGRTGAELHARMLGLGFTCVSYDPLERRLFEIEGPQYDEPNGIYVRDFAEAQRRVSTAPTYRVLGRDL